MSEATSGADLSICYPHIAALMQATLAGYSLPRNPEARRPQIVRSLSYAEFWVTRRSGGVVCRHLYDLDAVVESDTCDELGQLICAFEPPPGF